MYIEPNSDILLFRGAPFSPDYNHTVYFTDIQAQWTYFQNFQNKLSFIDQTYQRVNKNRLRIQTAVDTIRDYNYMAFKNTNYTNKWFYAFITSCEYVNNAVSEIEYKVDPLQSYFFDIGFLPCFVEREHSRTDTPGDNIVDEGLELGEYVSCFYKRVYANTLLDVVVGSVETQGSTVDGAMYDRIYHGDMLVCFHVNREGGLAALNQWLSAYVATPGNVTQIYTVPNEFTSQQSVTQYELATNTAAPEHVYVLGDCGITPDAELESPNRNYIDGYQPKNNKLYTYPYNFLHIDNGSGDSISLRYEFFNLPIARVSVACTLTQPVTLRLAPSFYKNSTLYLAEQVGLSGFPQCSWASDTYAAWLAQNTPIIGSTVAGHLLSGLINTKTATAFAVHPAAGAAYATASLAGTLIHDTVNTISDSVRASYATDVCRGSANSNVNCATDTQTFYYSRMCVNAQHARIIDDYFSRYGYAVKRIKRPDFTARPHWNYVKTKGCELSGSAPADAYREICDIMDNGITFWKNPFEVGHFELDNSLV